ncbi:preprotein translocase subunit YajC [Pseudoclavibacter terrae]|uniref:Preprotein translocase subunit YajC n=1 Tax=Pseudoclavibacter terrae TaxID=1530195 RepID=A0A7J5B397_9MICO|nr:preprotein translocase subunit YajC [Pseudoclavibacter terrae]KAB1638482.1 preprotein translocase subunit YajC [Pseudoclavibacter terrae]
MDLTLLLPLVLLGVMIFFMWRSNKKRTQQQQEMRSSAVIGADVMTQSGVYGTIVDIDDDNNITTIESEPGTRLRVHSMTIANILTPSVPDDASALSVEETVEEFPTTEPEHRDAADADRRDGDNGSESGPNTNKA